MDLLSGKKTMVLRKTSGQVIGFSTSRRLGVALGALALGGVAFGGDRR